MSVKAGGLLVGSCVGAHVAGEWARTPDGSAPRWLFAAEDLRKELVDAGWTEVSVVEAPRDGGGVDRLANLNHPKSTADRGIVRLLFFAVAPA